MKIRVRILETCDILNKPTGCHYDMDRDLLFRLFFPLPDIEWEIVPVTENADLCLCSVKLGDGNLLREEEFNVFIAIENLTFWPWYPHYNKYGEFGNAKIGMYIYNHIYEIIETPDYLAVPALFFRLRYFQTIYPIIRPDPSCSFSEKKFMLVINRSGLNPHIPLLKTMFEKMGTVDHISQYNQELGTSSCYHSPALLRVFHRYKFILTMENSYQPGYVTEKIFNVFLARSIPIYLGCPHIETYLNPESFIHLDFHHPNTALLETTIRHLSKDEGAYNNVIAQPKIHPSFLVPDYLEKMTTRIKIFFEKKKKHFPK